MKPVKPLSLGLVNSNSKCWLSACAANSTSMPTLVAHRWPIKKPFLKKATAEGKYIRQSGGRGQYGHCFLRVDPKNRGEGFEFLNEIRGGAIPREFIPAIEKGVKEALENGVLAGYSRWLMSSVAVYDGTFHEVDSSEMAFQNCRFHGPTISS
jgi:hypothetical protein